MSHTESKLQTPTETLMLCLEKFGESEPEKVVLAWVAQDGSVRCAKSGDASHTDYLLMLGLLETAKVMLGPAKSEGSED